MIVPFPGQAEVDVLLLYPGDSLMEQLDECLGNKEELTKMGLNEVGLKEVGVKVDTCFVTSLPEIRKALTGVRLAVLDATADPAQATDAFLQAVGQLGAYSVTVYTEEMHEGLEMFVRRRGAMLLLGPLKRHQWEEHFQRALEPNNRGRIFRKAA